VTPRNGGKRERLWNFEGERSWVNPNLKKFYHSAVKGGLIGIGCNLSEGGGFNRDDGLFHLNRKAKE